MESRHRTNYSITLALVMTVFIIGSLRSNSLSFISRRVGIKETKSVVETFRHSVRRSSHSGFDTDSFGRRIRRQEGIPNLKSKDRSLENSWGDFNVPNDDNERSPTNSQYFKKDADRTRQHLQKAEKSSFSYDRFKFNRPRSFDVKDRLIEMNDDKINMRSLEASGFVHLYGLSPILGALTANKRDFRACDADGKTASSRPETQMTPYLFVQEKISSKRSVGKANMSQRILELAKMRNIPVATVDKGILNTLSANRPHQGFVLRCGVYHFEPLSEIFMSDLNQWLILDEIVDPQNLGAIIRTARFLGDVQILVCAKNSAPPSAVVSASSAGALETSVVYETKNLPKTLAIAEQQGFRIIGASSGIVMDGMDCPVYDLQNLPVRNVINGRSEPTALVLGNEGNGLRHLVAKSCTEFVRIPGGVNGDNGDDLDSLNVSVSCGMLLWHLLQRKSLDVN